MELQFYIKNISRCLGMVYLISASRQYNHWNTQKSVLIFLQVDYIQTKIKCNKTSVFTRNLQAHKLYSPSYIILQTQNIAPVKTLPHLLKPIMIHILHLKQFYQWFNNLIRNWTNNMKNWFFSECIWLESHTAPRNSKKQVSTFIQNSLNKGRNFICLPHTLMNDSENMSVRNRLGIKIDRAKLEIETNIANNIAYIQDDNTKNMTTLDMKLSSIASNQLSYSFDQPHNDLLKWLLIKISEESTHAPKYTKHREMVHIYSKLEALHTSDYNKVPKEVFIVHRTHWKWSGYSHLWNSIYCSYYHYNNKRTEAVGRKPKIPPPPPPPMKTHWKLSGYYHLWNPTY